MADTHPYDEAASEIASWLESEAGYYADALRGGHAAPFSAPVSEKDKLDYYRRQVFMTNPDGTPDYTKPNTQGREQLIKRVGIPGYTQVMSAVLSRQSPSNPSDEEGPESLPEAPTEASSKGSY